MTFERSSERVCTFPYAVEDAWACYLSYVRLAPPRTVVNPILEVSQRAVPSC